jgi:transcriptional regulator with XRE-family HTH domain
MLTYLEQMEAAAQEKGVDLAKACKKADVEATTLMRWRKGDTTPREGTAEAVLKAIDDLAAEKDGAEPERAAS